MILQSALPFIAIALFVMALLSRRKESDGVFYSSWFGKLVGALGWVSFACYCYFETLRCLMLGDYVRTSFALIFLAFSLLLALLLVKTSENEDLFLFRTDIRLEEDLNEGIFPEELKKVFKTNGFSLSDNATITKRKENEWVIADEKMRYLFSIGAGLEDDLNKSTTSEELKNICKANKHPLSDNATITKEKENEWVIADSYK